MLSVALSAAIYTRKSDSEYSRLAESRLLLSAQQIHDESRSRVTEA